MKSKLLMFLMFGFFCKEISAQEINEEQVGAWYMYFWNTKSSDKGWGAQGDLQHRNWNLGGDMEQLMLRGGLTYSPNKADIKFTLGYAHIFTGTPGEETTTTSENRIYQEALFPQRIAQRFHLNHRIRYEQRFVEGQDQRSRFRYALFLNITLNSTEMEAGTYYLALYNELFVNGEQEIRNEVKVDYFDRNRFYTAVGYLLKDNLRVQTGIMRQTTAIWSKDQLQVSLHHQF